MRQNDRMTTAHPRPPRVLSGIQPTADAFHLGNYLGALREWARMQHTHDAYYCVVDQHAITVEHDPETLRRRTYASFAQLLAACEESMSRGWLDRAPGAVEVLSGRVPESVDSYLKTLVAAG